MIDLAPEEIAGLVAMAMALIVCIGALRGARRWQRLQQGDRKRQNPPPRQSEPDDRNRPRGPWG